MARTNQTKPPPSASHNIYLDGLQFLAQHAQDQLAKLMPHNVERGRIAEEILKNILTKTLPKRFSVGTGVIINSRGEASAQTDIVIYDNLNNSPLLVEYGSCVFPAEMVYATIEVKSVLNAERLDQSIKAIMRMREVCKERHYMVPGFKTIKGKRTATSKKHKGTVPPRNYIFAFSQKGLGPTYDHFCAKLRARLDSDHSHVHGVCVLDRNWFAARQAFRTPAELFGRDGNGLLTFYFNLIKGQENYLVHPIDLEAYLKGMSRA
ncbi:DUF6602 domain-containing protein [Bradyrhizobium australafricanum]|uniref:DUF6602 domain-containing protein n=1 Tax=Bradyrhizobium australafricanum TaxID=2821406 RepID=UPI001CE24C02|nr:DUF6602 domain-containing protein [Bradyrhizobium australafricanum]MCA6098896.1 hypothetical protein [Bradyrhizobium australafricanum]